ncbi:hypothetical protein JXB27_04390 [Candidatus Woesearchaeota archaeon]|nr:hypothetical protein [Candidatus Woesearchaeota archaeon]
MSESIRYILKKTLQAVKRKGFVYAITAARNRIYRMIAPSFIFLRKGRKFEFENEKLYYNLSKYGMCWNSERTIEMPIIIKILDKMNAKHRNMLEIGNVLNNYKKYGQIVVDKFEKNKGVINEDILNYKTKKKFDIMVSVSTLEHVGWDETPSKPENILLAVKNIKQNILKKGGILLFTIPIGYNPYIDSLIAKNKIKLEKEWYFKKISLSNKWKETTKKYAFSREYNYPYECANALFIGIMRN